MNYINHKDTYKFILFMLCILFLIYIYIDFLFSFKIIQYSILFYRYNIVSYTFFSISSSDSSLFHPQLNLLLFFNLNPQVYTPSFCNLYWQYIYTCLMLFCWNTVQTALKPTINKTREIKFFHMVIFLLKWFILYQYYK